MPPLNYFGAQHETPWPVETWQDTRSRNASTLPSSPVWVWPKKICSAIRLTCTRNLFPEQSCKVIYYHIMLFLGRYCLTASFTKLEILFQFLLFCTEKAALPGRRGQLFHLKTGLTFTFFQLRLTCRTCTCVKSSDWGRRNTWTSEDLLTSNLEDLYIPH